MTSIGDALVILGFFGFLGWVLQLLANGGRK